MQVPQEPFPSSYATMCFYEKFNFECGDFKWGNFKQHCNKEYRMGETCGMKLPYEPIQVQQKCRLCERYHTKLRKRQQEVDRIERWTAERKNPASIEKSKDAIKALDVEINEIYNEIYSRRQNLGGRRNVPQVQNYNYSNGYYQQPYAVGQ